jgi:cytochrome c oxidase subunit 4
MMERVEHGDAAGVYVLVWIGLLMLTALTYGLSRVDLGAAAILVALTIATAKSTLVIVFFMHYLKDVGTSRLTLFIAVGYLALLAGLSALDMKYRFPPSVASEESPPPTSWTPLRASPRGD